MKTSLCDQGILLIQLLGKADTWVIDHPEKFKGFDQCELRALFEEDFEIINLEELKENKRLANGSTKFWNLHTLILKKKIKSN